MLIDFGEYVMGMLVGAVLLDLKTRRVPNSYIILCSITGIYALWEEMGVWGCATFLLRYIWPIILLYGVYLIGGLGAGDVKLLGVISTLVEGRVMIRLILGSIVIGAMYGLLRLIKGRQLIQFCRNLWNQGCSFLIHKQKFAFIQWTKTGEKVHFTVCILMAYIGCICKEGVI